MPTKQEIRIGDCRELIKDLADKSIDCVVTSPPYFHMRNYKSTPLIYGGDKLCQHEWTDQTAKGTSGGISNKTMLERKGVDNFQITPDTDYSICKKCNAFRGELGWEPTPDMFIRDLVEVFELIRPKLKDTGSMWINLGDKWIDGDLALIPEQFALGMKRNKWILINKCCWIKPNRMPESVKRRLTKSSELVFHFVKNYDYWYDLDSVRKPFAQSSIKRFSQPNVMNQKGGSKQDELRGNPESGNASRCNKIVQQLAKNANTGLNNKEPYQTNNPHRIRLYQGKFEGMTEDCEQFGSPRARTQRSGFEYDGKWKEDQGYMNSFQQRINQERANGKHHDQALSHPLGANPGDVFIINTSPYPDAHFATFPLELVKIPILTTCPQYICKKCGKPRERITISDTMNRTSSNGCGNGELYDGSFGSSVHYQTGWSDCGCGAPFEAGWTLDPFAGSGTVLEFCRLNGRNAIGLELNPDYKPLATERGMLDQPQIQLGLKNTRII